MMKRSSILSLVLALGLGLVAHSADAITIDFSTEDDGVTPLVNGQAITSPPEFGTYFDLSSSGGSHEGLAIFDSDPAGPNGGGGAVDPDLLVDLGNVLILQSSDDPDLTGDIFDTPNDDSGGGEVIFDFLIPVELLSITLVDVNGSGALTLLLEDGDGLTRFYDVPNEWTHDISVGGPDGYQTLDLTTLVDQLGEGGSTATATEVVGFDPLNVFRLTVDFSGSAALDNLTFRPIPEPSTFALALLGLVGLFAVGRRVHRGN